MIIRGYEVFAVQIIVVGGFARLARFACVLQYRWLGQISDAERDRLQSRLRDDTNRFAEDFNREIQSVYFNFQIDARRLAKPKLERI